MSVTSARPSLLIGRERELKRLREQLMRASQSSGGFVLISGEAGTGKTSLLRRFAVEAIDEGARFISENFDRARSYEPYAPFFRIIERLNGSKAQKAYGKTFAGGGVAAAPRDAPGSKGFWDMESLYSLQKEHGLAQQHLTSALLESARSQLLVVALHDCHLAPLTAWQFIHYLARNCSDHKILILVTLRLDGREMLQSRVPVYADVLQRMNREGLVEEVRLKRFAKSDIRQLLHTVFPRSDFSSQFVPLLHKISGGVPEQLVKTLKIMERRGLVYQQNAVWFDKEVVPGQEIVRIVCDESDLYSAAEQTRALPPEQQQLLSYAALMDRPFEHLVLSALTHRPRLQVIKDLRALRSQKILRQVGDDGYLFKRPALRSVVMEEIPQSRRLVMHKEIAEALTAADYVDPTESVFCLAYHYGRTSDLPSAFRYLCEAGRLAVGHFAFPEAREYYERALRLILESPQLATSAEQARLLLQACWLDRVLGFWQESKEHCMAALNLCGEDDAAIRNEILIQAGLTYFRLNDWENAESCFQASLDAGQGTTPFNRAMANYGFGNVSFELGDYQRSRRFFEEALRLAEEVRSKHLMANVLNNLGAIENVRGRRLQAIALYSQSIPLFRSLGDEFGLARIYHNIGMSYADEMDWEQANYFYGKSLSVSDVMGLVPLKSITFLNRALALAQLHRFSEAREYNFKAYRLLSRLHDELGLAEFHKIQGVIEREQHNLTEATAHFDIALEKFGVLQNKLGCAETSYERGLLEATAGDEWERQRWFSKAVESFRSLGLPQKAEAIERLVGPLEGQIEDDVQAGYGT